MHSNHVATLATTAVLFLGGQAPAHAVQIVARDFVIEAPDTVDAGLTEFVLQNQGVLVHELVIGLLRPGAGTAEIVDAANHNARLKDLGDRYLDGHPFGALLAWPAQTSSAHLLVDLQPGRDYALLCQLRETPEAPQHASLGMVRVLHVR